MLIIDVDLEQRRIGVAVVPAAILGVGLVAMEQIEALGDLAAGTLVIYAPQRDQLAALQDSDPVQPPSGLSLRQQQAIISFSERLARLSESRQQELASHLSSLTGETGPAGVRKLLGYARWFARGGN